VQNFKYLQYVYQKAIKNAIYLYINKMNSPTFREFIEKYDVTFQDITVFLYEHVIDDIIIKHIGKNDICKMLEQYDNVYIYNFFGIYFCMQLNQYDLAETCYKMAINKEYIPSIRNLANMFMEQKNYVMAENYLLLCLAKIKYDDIYHISYSLYVLYTAMKNYELAKKYLLKVADSVEHKKYVNNNLGLIYYELGDYDSAEAYYLKAIEEDNSEISLRNLVYMYQVVPFKLHKALIKIKNKNEEISRYIKEFDTNNNLG
jgi:tetratricopeptide (TPR) repeat protein